MHGCQNMELSYFYPVVYRLASSLYQNIRVGRDHWIFLNRHDLQLVPPL